MACTVAVEESISEHYNSQIRALMEMDPERYTELLHVSQMLFCLFFLVLMHTVKHCKSGNPDKSKKGGKKK